MWLRTGYLRSQSLQTSQVSPMAESRPACGSGRATQAGQRKTSRIGGRDDNGLSFQGVRLDASRTCTGRSIAQRGNPIKRGVGS
jgi:hypothetical protein